MKTIATLALLTGLAVILSGCIVYVSPDKTTFHSMHHYKSEPEKPAPDEKPAPTGDAPAAS
jgi:hypothetical protein